VFAAGDLVPDFAVVVAGGFEEAGAGACGIAHFEDGKDAVELREDVAVQVEAARVLGSQVDGDTERVADLAEGRFVGGGEGVAAVLTEVEGGAGEGCGVDGDCECGEGCGAAEDSGAYRVAFTQPDCRESKSG